MKINFSFLSVAFFILFSAEKLSAQNLVPNPSFEDTVHCPNTAGEINYATDWMTPTLSSPDYYNTCSTDAWSSIPCNNYGCQSPHSGNAYVGIFTFSSPALQGNYREYIQIALIDSLISNRKYLVQFFVNLADTFIYECNDIGIYFSSQQISFPLIQSNLQYIPQAKNDTSNILSDKNGWTLISDTITAFGGEKYLTLGNFKPDSTSSNSLVNSGMTWPHAYYLIDDISVSVDTLDLNPEGIYNLLQQQIAIYPNPATEQLIIDNGQLIIKGIELFDLVGRKIMDDELLAHNSNHYSLNTKNFPRGYYFIRINTSEGMINRKIVLQ